MVLSDPDFHRQSDKWILDNYNSSTKDNVYLYGLIDTLDKESRENGYRTFPHYPGIMHKLEIYDDSYGDWYLIAGYMLPYALIRAQNDCDAYDIYLSEYVPDDNEYIQLRIEERIEVYQSDGKTSDEINAMIEEETDYGTYDDCGNWYSETTTCNIFFLDFTDYEIILSISTSQKNPFEKEPLFKL